MRGRAATAFLLGGLFVALVILVPTNAHAQWQVDSKDGKANFKFGFLLQGQYEGIQTEYNPGLPTAEKNWGQNLFIRRARLIFSGKYDKVSFFVETDSPNLGKASATTGVKDAGNMYIQDAWMTYTQSDAFMVDAGMFLVPITYQSLQSAATLMAVDYGPYSFLDSTVTGQRVGRDYGVQFRGYPIEKHLEYRVGIVQGVRQLWAGTVKDNAPFRYFGRVQFHVFESQTGFLYTGTSLGEKKMLDIGLSFSGQADYKTEAASLFFDWPIKGNGLTIQGDYAVYDGGTTFPFAAPPATEPQPLTLFGKHKVAFVEAGFYIKAAKLLPFVQWSDVKHDSVPATNVAALTKEDKILGGLAWMPYGHKFNLKLAYGKLGYSHNAATSIPDQTQVVLQAQFFYF